MFTGRKLTNKFGIYDWKVTVFFNDYTYSQINYKGIQSDVWVKWTWKWVVVITWTLILDPGFCVIALHRLDSTSAACDCLVVISIVVYGTEYTLPHANNEQCTGHAGYYTLYVAL
jgi:hypothetical protein